jgi:hypothetical protein
MNGKLGPWEKKIIRQAAELKRGNKNCGEKILEIGDECAKLLKKLKIK